MTPGPGHRQCTAYLWPGPGGAPLALPLTEGLGHSRDMGVRVAFSHAYSLGGDWASWLLAGFDCLGLAFVFLVRSARTCHASASFLRIHNLVAFLALPGLTCSVGLLR